MTTLINLIPDVEILLLLAPEELAETILKLVSKNQQSGQIHIQQITNQINGDIGANNGYPSIHRKEALLAVAEAWNWLIIQGIIIPAPDSNGHNGWMLLTRRGQKLLSDNSFKSYARSISFPKALLHPSIADEVWLDISRGKIDVAVFRAFKAVEISVREAGKFSDTDVGTNLMRKAFDKTIGPLTDMEQPEAEREALAHLFAGAIGSYKNPHSHRTVTICEASEAQEMVIIASHLLRIVDSRRK